MILKERDKCEKMKENLKNISENMRLNNADLKKIASLSIIYVTDGFNWLRDP